MYKFYQKETETVSNLPWIFIFAYVPKFIPKRKSVSMLLVGDPELTLIQGEGGKDLVSQQ